MIAKSRRGKVGLITDLQNKMRDLKIRVEVIEAHYFETMRDFSAKLEIFRQEIRRLKKGGK